MLISILDIAFLGMLLLVVGFYTSNKPVSPTYSFLPAGWFNKNSLLLIGLFLVLFSLKNSFGFFILRFQHHFFYKVASRLSKKNIINYLKDDYINFVTVDSSIHIRKISQQPVEFSHYILTNVQQVISQSILIIFTVSAILIYRPVLFLLLLILLLPPVFVLAYFIRKRSKQVRGHTKLASEKTIQHLQESLAGFIESNIYDKSDFLTNRYHNYQQQLNNNLAAQQTLQVLPSRLVEIFAVFGFFILVLVNKWSAHGAVIDLLTIGIFMASAYKIIPGIIKILNSTGQIKTYEFTLNDLLAIEDIAAVVSPLPNVISSVKFDRVSFNYKDQQILVNTDLQLNKGDFAGISAISGRGKTTLINLILGFLTPNAGSIMINDQKTDTSTRKQYLQRISYVKQQGYFIHDTILKNVTLSDNDCDPEKLAMAISISGLDTLLNGNAEGLNKMIRENGRNLSGGQRQRIMLARALYHDFDMLILDEPFGEMDQQAEDAILLQLKQLAASGRIILFITHNKASLNYCNKLITLE
ncbi:ABC transporter ATP-binding protein [Mucilaginibacter pocheonensis]|uniref:ABC-type bacteriocin/lantibiotic exporter with double-glycine peptidase domain n=1 Tax=Mucilaginibacter pocheonensis TaxID=398050 RepID=A0ABU1TD76_9SPHI|nr:ABC transporter ATP-binding protein [Mucilaginibacter pocheonensis]MDR6943353.1 ABC-type bacteriocin/lantibiotic exporter with double-glycine peptidase domain [Mucilaginibacter pocheonensis]